MSALSADASGVIVACPSCDKRNRIAYTRLDRAAKCANCGAGLASPADPVEIPSAAAFEALVGTAAIPVLIDFWAAWCQPCHMVAPEIRKVAAARTGALLVAKLDTEAVPDVAASLQIRSIPTMAVFAKGREVGRTSGARPAAAILAFVDQHVGSP